MFIGYCTVFEEQIHQLAAIKFAQSHGYPGNAFGRMCRKLGFNNYALNFSGGKRISRQIIKKKVAARSGIFSVPALIVLVPIAPPAASFVFQDADMCVFFIERHIIYIFRISFFVRVIPICGHVGEFYGVVGF